MYVRMCIERSCYHGNEHLIEYSNPTDFCPLIKWNGLFFLITGMLNKRRLQDFDHSAFGF